MPRQCSSCGGFCNKSGCARESAQPEKEWIGLTDGEIDKLRINNSDGNFSLPYSFARAMEALLKEKNC